MKRRRLIPQTDLSQSISRSDIYKEFLAEKEEVMRHKWLESEKAGYDIGYERALVDWIMNHREKWLASRIKPKKQ
ncbi:MAG: hypothetical protein IKA42_04200 [Clostridia bacterium]|nr:hypothetical protein [Clostridia bacterium]